MFFGMKFRLKRKILSLSTLCESSNDRNKYEPYKFCDIFSNENILSIDTVDDGTVSNSIAISLNC